MEDHGFGEKAPDYHDWKEAMPPLFEQPKKARSQPQAKPKATNNKHRIPLLGLPVVPFSFFG